MRSLSEPNRDSRRERICAAEDSSPVRKAERNKFSWMTQDSGVSREKSSESGHGRDEVGGLERMSGAFCERESAVGGAILEGGVRRFAVAIAEVVCID